MNYSRIALAFLGATAAYLVSGGAMFLALPAIKSEFMKYPSIYRSDDGMKKAMPYNMAAILIRIAVVAVLYAKFVLQAAAFPPAYTSELSSAFFPSAPTPFTTMPF